jgi:DNA-binding IclR family transcriptional regulator
MSSLTKMLAILDLFSLERSTWSSDDLLERSGHSRPTGYRYIKELCDAGLLRRSEGGYSLGARVIELDYYIRQCDPLLNTCRPAMNRLARETGCDVLLASMYGSRILAIHQEPGSQTGPIAFGRGRPMPLFRGGGSKVILASLSSAKHKKLYEQHGSEIAKAGLGKTWAEFRARMLEIQRQGYVISMGELDPDAAGIAVSVSSGQLLDASALIVVTTKTRFNLIDKPLLIDFLKNAAQQIELSARRGRDGGVTPTPVATPRMSKPVPVRSVQRPRLRAVKR